MLVITSASMCAAVSESRSAATRTGRRSDISWYRKQFHQTAQRQLITVGSEPADYSQSCVGERRAPALRLARVDVREMNLNEWDLHSGERVADSKARVAVSPRVHERAVDATPQSVHCLDDFPFPIVL